MLARRRGDYDAVAAVVALYRWTGCKQERAEAQHAEACMKQVGSLRA